LPYTFAANPKKEHDVVVGGKQALGNIEVGSSQKQVVEM
jgi:hypothetical protein